MEMEHGERNLATGLAEGNVTEEEEMSPAAASASRFRKVCVFCGSQTGKKTNYQQAALELGNELVKSGIDLVYGGGSIGLMALFLTLSIMEVAMVIPRSLTEVTGVTVGEVKAVSDMHERKAEMARQADAFIALPGGYGTLEELLEMITGAQLGIHRKPVGLLNVDGFYNSLVAFIDIAVEEGFISEAARSIIISSPSAKDLVRKMEEYVPEYQCNLVWGTDKKLLKLLSEPEISMAS